MPNPSSPSAAAAARHQRADGAAAVEFARARGRTVLRHLAQSAPLRVLFPDPEPGEPPVAALVNTAGGLAGGDALRISAALGPGACATLTTPAAEKVYRSLGPDTTVAVRLDLGADAALEWLPQETILFDAARLSRRTEADLAPGARLLAVETLVLGRTARGERFGAGALLDSWRLRAAGRPLWADGLRLDPAGAALGGTFGFGEAEALGTLVYAGADAAAGLAPLRAGAAGAGCRCGASLVRPGLLLGRWLGAARAVRDALGAAVVLLRAALLGLPPRPPRLWAT